MSGREKDVLLFFLVTLVPALFVILGCPRKSLKNAAVLLTVCYGMICLSGVPRLDYGAAFDDKSKDGWLFILVTLAPAVIVLLLSTPRFLKSAAIVTTVIYVLCWAALAALTMTLGTINTSRKDQEEARDSLIWLVAAYVLSIWGMYAMKVWSIHKDKTSKWQPVAPAPPQQAAAIDLAKESREGNWDEE